MLIEVTDLSKVYMQGENVINAVNHVNLQIMKGEMVAITGQSGSGKTTLLSLIGGTEIATSGSIKIDGEEIVGADNETLSTFRRRKVGAIFQDFNLIPILTVEENIMMPVLLDSRKVDKNKVRKLASSLGLEERLNHLPSELSGGQKQRVAIARALINKPGILLADEPTGNLDRKMADEIMHLLLQLNKSGITVLLVTHEERYADMCQRKIIISDGRIE